MILTVPFSFGNSVIVAHRLRCDWYSHVTHSCKMPIVAEKISIKYNKCDTVISRHNQKSYRMFGITSVDH